MYLKALHLQGFKSFPDKTVLEFGKGLTAVVGPNGSGKSNIADAVRWVLGEQSTKSLRGSRMEDVIFSGTGARKAQGFAEVTLVLDNSDRALAADADEVSVTRRYYRSGESAYLINRKTVRLRDVNELFMDTGLGRDGYSMVSQGRIEEMVSAKSENRRDMFEEAAGISHYRYRREDALRRLGQTEENLVRLRDIVTELKNRVGPLEKQSLKAQQFLVYAGEKKELEIGLWLETLTAGAEQIRRQASRLGVARGQYEETSAALEALSETMEKAAETVRDVNVRAEAVRAENRRVEEEAAALDSAAAVAETGTQHNAETKARIERDRETEQARLRQNAERAEAVRHTLETVESSLEETRKKLSELSGALTGLLSKDKDYSDRYNEKNAVLGSLIAEISRREVESGAAQSRIGEIGTRVEALALAEEKQKENRALIEDRLLAANKKKDAALAARASLKNKADGVTMKRDKAASRAEEVKAAAERDRLDLLSGRSRLQFLIETERNMEGYQGSVKAVMREKKRGALTGVRGTVFQLLSVEERYQTAVETALGGAIQNIVVETDSDAKRAIGFLKNANAGRATFLPLSAVKGRTLDEQGLDDSFGYVGIASDLCRYDPEYDGVIRSLLGRTAVCEDLDCAVVMAKRYKYRFRIVTLDGQVVNAGGSMTGGSRTNSAGFFARKSETERLTAETAELEKRLKKRQEELEDRQRETARLDAELAALTKQDAGVAEEQALAENAAALFTSQLAENDARLSEIDADRQDCLSRIAEIEGREKTAAADLAALAARKASLEAELGELTGGRDEMLSRREALTAEMNETNLTLASLQHEKETGETRLRELAAEDAGTKTRIASLDAESAELVRRDEALRQEADSARARAAEKREAIKAGEEILAGLFRRRDEAEKATADARAEEKAKTEDREKLSAEIVRLEERKAALEKEQQDTERRLFEEYSLTRREAEAQVKPLESVPAARKRLSELKGLIKGLGSVNVSAIEEYKEVRSRYDFLSGQVDDVETAKKELLKLIDELTGQMSELFRDRFNAINENFKQTFTQLFGGGAAELVLEDENDILQCGISIKAQPPGKNVKNLSLLSGGEKGLTAIALLFSILKVRPAPFCVFDEVEAALDDVNVTKYAQYVRLMSDDTQFILITHRRGTMEEADILYGVTMEERGVSKLLELKTAEMVARLQLDE